MTPLPGSLGAVGSPIVPGATVSFAFATEHLCLPVFVQGISSLQPQEANTRSGTIGKSGLGWPHFPLSLALSLDLDQRRNPEKTPSQIEWLKHLLGIYILCRLSSLLAVLTGGLT